MASFAWTGAAEGAHALSALATDFSGTTAQSAAVTITIAPSRPRLTWLNPVQHDVFQSADAVTLLVDARPGAAGAAITGVEFFALAPGATVPESLGTVSAAPWEFTWSAPAAEGAWELTAVATDATGATTTAALTVHVSADLTAPPVLDILSPEDAETITAPITVTGTVSGPALQNYTLQLRAVRPDNDAAWQTLATGAAGVTDGVLGTLDPTLLENGSYELRLLAGTWDGGTVAADPVSLLLDGNMKIGHFALAFEDLSVAMPGLSVTVTRSYDSRRTDSADFGVGWDLAVSSMRLVKNRPVGQGYVVASAGLASISQLAGQNIDLWCARAPLRKMITLALPDGTALTFKPRLEVHPSVRIYSPEPDCSIVPQNQVKIVFTPVGKTLGTLEPIDPPEDIAYPELNDGPYGPGAGKPGVCRLQGGMLSKGLPGLDPVYEPVKFKYTSPEGAVFIVEEAKGVESLTDRNGNSLTFTPEAITYSNGMAITFTRDALQRISAITDSAGQQLLYGYDAQGRLTTFTDRTGAITEYRYTNAAYPFYLTEIIDPLGHRAVKSLFDAGGRLIGQEDADGHAIVMNHDIANRREEITDRLGHTTVHEYDLNGNVVKTTDALGGITERSYDARDRELTVTDPLGHLTRKSYDASDNVLTETDALGHITRYAYNSTKQPLSITDPLGPLTTFSYDANGNLTTMTDAAGQPVQLTHSGNGQLATMTDLSGNTTSNTYDGITGVQLSQTVTGPDGVVLSHTTYGYDANLRQNLVEDYTVPAGATNTAGATLYRRTQNTLDASGRIRQSRLYDGAGTLLTHTTTVYNAAGKPLTVTDVLGRVTSHAYDDQGREVRTTLPDNTFTEAGFDLEGRQVTSRDVNGRTTTTTYDVLGRGSKITAPDGTFTTTAYDTAGRMITSTDARGNTTTYAHDDAGHVTAVTNALDQITAYAYDDAGRQVTMTDALGHVTTTHYDTLSRPVKITAHDGTFTETFYDTAGRRIAQKDQAGIVTNYEYDAQSRLTAVVDAQSQRTEYRYDQFGRQTHQIDALGRITTYEYDVQGRRVKRTLPLGMFETVAYDAAGRMASRTDFNGRTTTFAYDIMSRVLSRTPDAVFSETPVTWTYYPDGKRHTMTDPTGITTYTYDNRDRLTQKASPQGTLNYAYDAAGNLTSITTATANGASMTYTYDALNRIDTVADLNDQTTTYSYDDVGNLESTALPNGVTSTYTYSPLNRLLNLSSTKAGNTIASYAYTLNATGHRLTCGEVLQTASALTTRNLGYAYDSLHRLTSETISAATDPPPSGTATPSGFSQWTYDAVSNRLTQTSTLPNIPNQTHTYDDNDRLDTDTYDDNGNTLTGSVSQLSPLDAPPLAGIDAYDSHDRLIARQAADGAYVWTRYNGDGHRVEHHLYRPAAGATAASYTVTRYLVDDLNPTGYAQVLEETLSLNGQAATLSAIYTYGHDLISQDRLSPATTQWSLSYYGYDGHGSVRYLTDAVGTITDTYDYDAWGQLLHTTGATTNPYLYTGEQFDPSLGLYHLRARMMNPLTGRFWNADTYEGTQDPASLHKYLYTTSSDPVNCTDPSGNFELTLAGVTFNITLQNVIRGIAINAGIGGVLGSIIGGVDAYLGGEDVFGGAMSGLIGGSISGALLGPFKHFKTASAILGLMGLATGFSGAYSSFEEGNNAQGAFRSAMGVLSLSPWLKLFTGGLRNQVPPRTAGDTRVSGSTPRPNNPVGYIGNTAEQEALLSLHMRLARLLGGRNFRVNQYQVNAGAAEVAGRNRPDFSFDWLKWRINIEYDRASSGRGIGHRLRILSNDGAAVIFEFIRG